MKLIELLKLANEGYPDGFLTECFDPDTGEFKENGTGDTLAESIAAELIDTFDPAKEDAVQIAEALAALDTMALDVAAVSQAFRRHLSELRPTVNPA